MCVHVSVRCSAKLKSFDKWIFQFSQFISQLLLINWLRNGSFSQTFRHPFRLIPTEYERRPCRVRFAKRKHFVYQSNELEKITPDLWLISHGANGARAIASVSAQVETIQKTNACTGNDCAVRIPSHKSIVDSAVNNCFTFQPNPTQRYRTNTSACYCQFIGCGWLAGALSVARPIGISVWKFSRGLNEPHVIECTLYATYYRNIEPYALPFFMPTSHIVR